MITPVTPISSGRINLTGGGMVVVVDVSFTEPNAGATMVTVTRTGTVVANNLPL